MELSKAFRSPHFVEVLERRYVSVYGRLIRTQGLGKLMAFDLEH